MLLNKFYTHRNPGGCCFLAQQGLKCTQGGDSMEKLEVLKQWINESNRIVFFGGAGVSTENVN